MPTTTPDRAPRLNPYSTPQPRRTAAVARRPAAGPTSTDPKAPGPRRAASTGRRAPVPSGREPTAADVAAARVSLHVLDALAAAFGARAPSIDCGALEVESFDARLTQLCDTANDTLAAFASLSLPSPAASPAAPLVAQVERGCDAVRRSVAALADDVARQRGPSGRGVAGAAEDAHAAVRDLRGAAAVCGEVRDVVARRDAPAAAALLRKRRGAVAADPLLRWLRDAWLPAAEDWLAVVGAVAAALRAKDGAALRGAVAAARTAVADRSVDLRRQLLPGETLEQRLEADVEAPARDVLARLDRQDAVRARLRSAIAAVDFQGLSVALRDAEAAGLSGKSDTGLVAEAHTLLLDVQHVARCGVQLSKATKDPVDAATLVAALHAANELIRRMVLFEDDAQSAATIAAGTKWMARLAKAPGSVVELPVEDLLTAHVPSRAWAPEMSALYRRAADALRALASAASIRRRLAEALAKLRDGGTVEGPHEALLARAADCGLGDTPDARELDLHLRRARGVTVKVHYDSATRIVSCAQRQEFGPVRRDIAAALEATDSRGPLRLRYEDGDDYVTLASQADWDVLVGDCLLRNGHTHHGLRLEVYADHPTRAPAVTPPRPLQAPHAVPISPLVPPKPELKPKPVAVDPKTSPVPRKARALRPEGGRGGQAETRAEGGAEPQRPPTSAQPRNVAGDAARPRTHGDAQIGNAGWLPAGRLGQPPLWSKAGADLELQTVASEATCAPFPQRGANRPGPSGQKARGSAGHGPSNPAPWQEAGGMVFASVPSEPSEAPPRDLPRRDPPAAVRSPVPVSRQQGGHQGRLPRRPPAGPKAPSTNQNGSSSDLGSFVLQGRNVK